MGKKAWLTLKQFAGWVWNALPLGLALLTFLWVLFAAVIWPIANARNFRASFDLGNGRILEVWGPELVPLESPVDLHFALHQEGDSGAPITLRVTIPEDLVMLSTLPNPLVRQVTLTFNGTSPEETLVIQVANAKQRSGLGLTRQTIAIEQSQGEEQQNEATFSQVGTVGLSIEQTWRGVLRQGGGGAVSFGPIITLVTSLGTILYQTLLHSREEQKERERKQKEQEQERKQKEQERVRQAQESLKKIYQALQERNLETVEKNLLQIEQGGLEAYLEANDLALARQLLQLAKGNIQPLSFDNLLPEWLEAAAGAVLYAARHNLTNRPMLEQLMRSFPADKLGDTSLKEEWQDVSNNIGVGIPSQAREWPRPIVDAWPVFASPPASELKSNPFPSDRAEEEETYLFARSKGLFWSSHRVFQALKEQRSAWVVGEPGSGKTALALAIGKYLLSDKVFSEKGLAYYFRGLPSIVEIRHALARRLLDSILQNPSYLPLGEEQHRLLAEVLLTALPASLILGCIARTASTADWEWLVQAANDAQRAIWQAEARSRLRLLEEAVRKDNSPFPKLVWPTAWSAAIRFLCFDLCTRLVFDLDASPSARRESDTLDTLARWTEDGIYTLVFSLPNKRLEQALAGWTSRLDLTWNERDMSEMAEWRWGQVYPERKFETLFGDPRANAKTFFIRQARGNPACLIRLWNQLVHSGMSIPLTPTQIEAAAKKL